MNDFYSFLRFALPGISSITEFMILLSFSMNWKLVLQIPEIKSSNLPFALEIAIFTFFTIGIGFMYNLIYRTIPFMRIDYSVFAKKLKRQNLISLDFKDYATEQSVLDKITKDNSWGIVNTLWHSRSGKSSLIKEATERSEKFAHLLHNSGTSLIGFATALIFYYLVVFNYYEYFDRCRLLLVFIFLVFPLGIAHYEFFRRTLLDFRRFVEVILYADLSKISAKISKSKKTKKQK